MFQKHHLVIKSIGEGPDSKGLIWSNLNKKNIKQSRKFKKVQKDSNKPKKDSRRFKIVHEGYKKVQSVPRRFNKLQ